jgi:hypothetical protein
VTAGEGDVNNSAKVQSSPRQTVKQQSSKPQAAVTKSKTAAQPVQETTKKVCLDWFNVNQSFMFRHSYTIIHVILLK